MKVFIDKDEQYPFYRIRDGKADSIQEIEVEVEKFTMDHWNGVWLMFWKMQAEMKVLHDKGKK